MVHAELNWARAHRDFDLDLIDSSMADTYLRIDDRGAWLDKRWMLPSYRAGPRKRDAAEMEAWSAPRKDGDSIARNLLKAGHSLSVYDLDPQKIQAVVGAGGRVAKSAREVARFG